MELASIYEKLKSDSEASDHPIDFKINPQNQLCPFIFSILNQAVHFLEYFAIMGK